MKKPDVWQRFQVQGTVWNWKKFARQTVLAHVRNILTENLRFFQYIDSATADWWSAQCTHGAILLGKTAKALGLTPI